MRICLCAALTGILACGEPRATPPQPAEAVPTSVQADLSTLRDNPAPWIPEACYANTQPEPGTVRNPCATCHQRPRRPNFVADADLQIVSAMPGPATENHWSNLFVDRTAQRAAIDEETILAWVRTDNYRNSDRLRIVDDLPEGWGGLVPDAWFDVDADGYDRTPDGTLTGWRSYLYQPFPGFFPSNGSWGDAMIRLPEALRTDEQGHPDQEIYSVNLAIVEAMVTWGDVALDAPIDEERLSVDLDRDGTLGEAQLVRFDWVPRRGRRMSYVGAARLQPDHQPVAGLFPQGTELLHSVRYLDVVEGEVRMAPRMKELRYAIKQSAQTYAELSEAGASEVKERHDFPDRLKQVVGSGEQGVFNGLGWRLQGFIEASDGALRPQTFEELAACVGCHGGIGANVDSGFSFPRRTAWGHSDRGVYALPDRVRADGRGEYAHYLEQSLTGDDLSANPEVRERFWDGDHLDPEAMAALAMDVAPLLIPSPERALELDRTYRIIVSEQGFTRGRVAASGLTERQAHRHLASEQPTGVLREILPPWMRPSP